MEEFKRESETGDGLSLNQQRVLQQALTNYEEKIVANPNEEAIKPTMDYFNRFSDKNYVYIWQSVKGRFTSKDQATKIELPIINGRQSEAKDVWHTAKKRNMSIEDVLIEMGALK